MRKDFVRLGMALVVLAAVGLVGPAARADSVLNTPASHGKDSEPDGLSDHELVVHEVGIRVVHWGKISAAFDAVPNLLQGLGTTATGTGTGTGAAAAASSPSAAADLNLTAIGVRYWFNNKIGLDAGFGLYLHKPAAGDTQFGMAFVGGVPIALGWFKHLTVYIEPRIDVGFMRVASGNTPVNFGVGGDLGAEISMGFLGIPRLTLDLALGLELRLQHTSGADDLVLSTRDFLDTLAFNLGVTYYF